jgi:hypothetical protein
MPSQTGTLLQPAVPVPRPAQLVHLFFDDIGPLGMAAFLREAGRWLYNRDITQWRVLVDVSDELLERETFAAKERLLETWLRKPLDKPALRAQRRSRKQRA